MLHYYINARIIPRIIPRYELPALDRSEMYVAQPVKGIWVHVHVGKNRYQARSKHGVVMDSGILSNRIDRTDIIAYLADGVIWISDMLQLIGFDLMESNFAERWERARSFMEILSDEYGDHGFNLIDPVYTLFVPLYDKVMDLGFDGILIKPRYTGLACINNRKKGWYFCGHRGVIHGNRI